MSGILYLNITQIHSDPRWTMQFPGVSEPTPGKKKNVNPLPRQIPEHTLSLPEAPLSSTPSITAIVSLGEHFILYSLKYGSLVIVFLKFKCTINLFLMKS